MNTTKENTQLLIEAAIRGDGAEVRGLIPLSSPKAHNSYALQLAARDGHTQCVQLLIPVSDPKDNESLALQWAAHHGHTDCVDLLFDVSDPDVALERLKTDLPKNPETWQDLEEKITVQRQHALLTQKTSHATSVASKVKKI